MMGKKAEDATKQVEKVCLDQLVPREHMVRKLKAAVDLSFIYEEVEDLYANYGTVSIDPVVLIKLNIVQYIFGIRSMRQTLRDAEVNTAYRRYPGYGMMERLPHFSTFSKNYARKFGKTNLFEKIFKEVLTRIAKAGYLDLGSMYVDGTHTKAGANNHKFTIEAVEKATASYADELRREIDLDRAAHGKKPLKDDPEAEAETHEVKVSTTDPDCGVFHKGEHKVEFAYCANVACDGHNYILDFETSAGNENDSASFPKLYDRLIEEYPQIENVVMDAGYKTPAIARQVIQSRKTPVMPYKRPMTKDGFFKKYEYV